MLALIAARDTHGWVIGANNALPWCLPEDLKRFKSLTLGCSLIMGRKTHESIGRALPGRRNIVISRSMRQWEGCEVAHSLEDALDLVKGEFERGKKVFVIGGGEIYRQAMPLARQIYMTEIDIQVEGDTTFPSFDKNDWREVLPREEHEAKPPAPAFSFVKYQRRQIKRKQAMLLRKTSRHFHLKAQAPKG